MSFKVVISDPKTKKSYQKEVQKNESAMVGRRIGDKVKGDFLGLPGYELEVTGGSDKQGFPMRRDVSGNARKRVLIIGPPGFHPEHKGERRRKSVRGNTISSAIVQVNTKVITPGKKSLDELLGAKEKKEEKPKEEAPKEEVKEKEQEQPKEEKKPEEKPKEEVQKEEPKAEEKKEAPKEEPKKEEPKQEEKPAEKPVETKPSEKKEEKPAESKEEPKKEENAKEPGAEEKPSEKKE